MEPKATDDSEDQRAREWRIMEEQRELEQQYMRVYTDYTLTVLDPIAKCKLEEQPEWTAALQHVYDHENCRGVLWGHDIKYHGRILVLFEWSAGTPQEQKEDDTAWCVLEHLLESLPQPQHIALHPPGLFEYTGTRAGSSLDELMIIRGDDTIFTPPDPLQLFELEGLAASTIPVISHQPVVEFAGYAQGITPSTCDGQRTIAILWSWVDEDRRSRFVDPKHPSMGRDAAYYEAVASPLRNLQAQGATVDSYLCYLRRWRPPIAAPKRQKLCTIM